MNNYSPESMERARETGKIGGEISAKVRRKRGTLVSNMKKASEASVKSREENGTMLSHMQKVWKARDAARRRREKARLSKVRSVIQLKKQTK